MAGRQLRVGEYVRIRPDIAPYWTKYLGDRGLGRVSFDYGRGRCSRYLVDFIGPGGDFPVRLPRVDLTVARLTEEETLLVLERELLR